MTKHDTYFEFPWYLQAFFINKHISSENFSILVTIRCWNNIRLKLELLQVQFLHYEHSWLLTELKRCSLEV